MGEFRAQAGLPFASVLILRKLATGAPPEPADESGPQDPSAAPSESAAAHAPSAESASAVESEEAIA